MPFNRRTFALTVLVVVVLTAIFGFGNVAPANLRAATPAGWTLTDSVSTEASTKPDYNITIHRPVLANDKNLGTVVDRIVNDLTTQFKKDAAEAIEGPADQASSLDLSYDVYVTRKGLISLRFGVATYIRGAAHPGYYSIALNYNAAIGKVLNLADLFKPKSKYLEFLSTYCSAELKRRDLLNFPEGALAKAENYTNWNLDRGGLLITFDPYQVGPWAQGLSEVLVPYSVLADLLQEDAWSLT